MIELYHFWSSVCSVRCRMALEEKGVAWTSRYVDLFNFDQMKPEYLAINPDGVVPTLVHAGQPVHESTIINEYIDAAFDGPQLVPSDPLLAARMREFVRKCEDGFGAIVKLTAVKYLLPKLRNRWSDEELARQVERRPVKFYRDVHGRALRGEIDEAELAEERKTIEGILDALEARLDPGPWVIGDHFTLADITVAPYMYRLWAMGADQFWSASRRPRIHGWYKRIEERPAFKIAVSWPDETGGGYEEVGLGDKLARS
ncbi:MULTISPECIES: glutathione S-transferase family protein [unclassified Beijerinckia]|uniref:glutathione S-transferase family protein n=1 Tax=unclassified Beijerinckia TaxID=2638183 RepID=UPI00089B7F64|nr:MULTISPECIES: glutathione S-transferase family protein [unclassified Beijerinckia]MDH7799388.1 glutathione S-transferase [Beijerinckia sp. GAS462]SED48664.1 glutathione S-transferase/GST-like protein [Beijerinckia sp. 28-YEA-48]